MVRRHLIALVALLAVSSSMGLAADTLSPKPQGAEVAFVSGVQNDLNARFATIAQAQAAGYFRFTNEDNTGSISYANLHWTSSDPEHPSQLWYSVDGKLLGADFSRPYEAGNPPKLWGVNPQRWGHFGAHIHWVLDVNGKETYGATSVAKFKAAGGDPDNPQAATVVALGKAKDVSQVKHVFLFNNIWDLEVWVLPNPNGAFAEMNPNVHPSANAQSME
ncbi:MAG TPA: hypothetical protein VMV65_09480 [Alphaproteobacteria bacterium]|nr:hypothetical protein [Candidatus Acidoferrales bacterium]HUN30028.1 hypothetical protein [Alphaproteobacteria bacterium]